MKAVTTEVVRLLWIENKYSKRALNNMKQSVYMLDRQY